VLAEESIGKPTPCWISIDRIAELLRVSYEAASMLAYDCEKAGLVRFHRSETAKILEMPRSACLTDAGRRLA
jgi:DNA-binding MarR family transcriptional regulator